MTRRDISQIALTSLHSGAKLMKQDTQRTNELLTYIYIYIYILPNSTKEPLKTPCRVTRLPERPRDRNATSAVAYESIYRRSLSLSRRVLPREITTTSCASFRNCREKFATELREAYVTLSMRRPAALQILSLKGISCFSLPITDRTVAGK